VPPGLYKVWEEMPECWEPTTPGRRWNDGYYQMVQLHPHEEPTFRFGNTNTCTAPPEICVDLEKTGPETAEPGDVITYNFQVRNCGDIAFEGGVQVYDPLFGDDPIWSGSLGLGQIIEFDMPYTLPGDHCGDFANSAWVIGHVPGYPEARDDDSWTVRVICEPEPCLRIRKILEGAFTDPYADEPPPDLPEPVDHIRVRAGWPTRFHLTIEVENCGNVNLTGVEVDDVIENWMAPRTVLECSHGSPPEMRPPGDDGPGLDPIVWTIGDLPAGQSGYLKLLIETLRDPHDQYAPTLPDQVIEINRGAMVHAVAPGFVASDATTEGITLTMQPSDNEHVSLITPRLPYSTPWAYMIFTSATAPTSAESP